MECDDGTLDCTCRVIRGAGALDPTDQKIKNTFTQQGRKKALQINLCSAWDIDIAGFIRFRNGTVLAGPSSGPDDLPLNQMIRTLTRSCLRHSLPFPHPPPQGAGGFSGVIGPTSLLFR